MKDIQIVPHHPLYIPELYEICLATGSAGASAEGQFPDRSMLGHVYLGPYLDLEPELSRIAVLNGRALGYIVGCSDSQRFLEDFRASWLPQLLLRYSSIPAGFPAANALATHLQRLSNADSYSAKASWHDEYPAELHIDILPEGQGQGLGRRLMQAFMDALRGRAPGLHLGVDTRNTAAVAFYEKLGFIQLESAPGVIWMGKVLEP